MIRRQPIPVKTKEQGATSSLFERKDESVDIFPIKEEFLFSPTISRRLRQDYHRRAKIISLIPKAFGAEGPSESRLGGTTRGYIV